MSLLKDYNKQPVSLGDIISSVEQRWFGRIVGIRKHNEEDMLHCVHISTVTLQPEWDDTRWYAPNDVVITEEFKPEHPVTVYSAHNQTLREWHIIPHPTIKPQQGCSILVKSPAGEVYSGNLKSYFATPYEAWLIEEQRCLNTFNMHSKIATEAWNAAERATKEKMKVKPCK